MPAVPVLLRSSRSFGELLRTNTTKKAGALKIQQAEIAARIEQHQTGDGAFRTTLESLISVASCAADLFERSKTEQKRKLVSLVFSNLRLSKKKLEYTMRSPYDLMVNRPTHASSVLWR